MSVLSEQRYKVSSPCPICGGWDSARRGEGVRCWGFISSDGRYAHCTREEYAGDLESHPGSGTFAHRLHGKCNCGDEHDSEARTDLDDLERESVSEIEAKYDYRDAKGNLLSQVVRYKPKGFRQRRPNGNGEWIWNVKGVPRALIRR